MQAVTAYSLNRSPDSIGAVGEARTKSEMLWSHEQTQLSRPDRVIRSAKSTDLERLYNAMEFLLLTCKRSLYFSSIFCFRSSSSFRRRSLRISAISSWVLRSDSPLGLSMLPFDSLVSFLASSSSSLKLSSRISDSLPLSVLFWTTLLYSTLPPAWLGPIFVRIGCSHLQRKFVPKKISFCSRRAFWRRRMFVTECCWRTAKKLIHYLRDFDVNIASTKNRLGRVVCEWGEACQSNILLKSHQLVI